MNEEREKFIKNLKIIELNMDYYLDLWYDKNRERNKKLIEKNKMLIMLGLEKEELKNLSEEYKEVKRYMENLNYINHSPEFREYMTEEEDKRKIFNTKIREAEEKGLNKGLEQSKKEIAIELLKMDMNIDDIIKVTKLSKEEILKIKSED